MMLQHQVDVPPRLDGGAHGSRHFINPVLIDDRVHGIEPQTIEAKLGKPVQHILREVVAHFTTAEINRRSPRGMTIVAEELRSVEREVITVRPKVIVNHVEKDHQTVIMRFIDQRLQVIG